MKRIIIIIAVIAAVGGVIVLKKTSDGNDDALCPCKMLEPTETNQTDTGSIDVE